MVDRRRAGSHRAIDRLDFDKITPEWDRITPALDRIGPAIERITPDWVDEHRLPSLAS